MSATIVFSHANGFPAGTYRVLFEAWRNAGYRVVALEKYGHDPAYPVMSNWRHVRDQLIDFIAAEAPGEKVHLVGHSLGGFLSLLAACRKPEMAASVVLLDSPVVAGWRAHSLQVMKLTRLLPKVSPGKVSQGRRWQWADTAAVHKHFAAKSVFARWDPAVLQDYTTAGTEPDEGGGVRLAFQREVETRFYNTLPHHMGLVLHKHPPRCPVHFIGGTQSAEVRQVGLAATKAVTRGPLHWIEGSHLYPMEKPQQTADTVLECIAKPPHHVDAATATATR